MRSIALLAQTIDGYERSLNIAQNRYNAGIAARTDVLQAQTQLANAQADLLGLERQRAQLEHAIAVLVGQAPAELHFARAARLEGRRARRAVRRALDAVAAPSRYRRRRAARRPGQRADRHRAGRATSRA